MSHSRIFQRNRALGYVSNHVPVVTRYIQRRKENLIVTCTGRSFHTYGCTHFTLLTVSGAHPEDITCLSADTFHVYTASGNKVYAWRRGNELKHTYNGHDSEVHLLMPFGPHLLSIDETNNLKIWDIQTEEMISDYNFNIKLFKITALMHPHTYINKIVLGSEQGQMQLWNIKKMKMIYTFEGWQSPITIIEQSPAVNVVAVGLENGKIVLHNLEVDETVFELIQDWGKITSITFRTDGDPIMATGSQQGHIVLWNLEKRKVESQILNAHFDSVTGLKCLPNEPLMVSSSPDNTLKLWVFDLADGAGRLLRLREGHAKPPTVIRFYGDNGQNILSAGEDSSLRIFSTETEIFNKSLGRASYNRKASKKKNRSEDDPLIMPAIFDFVCESTREKDWDNIAAAHHGLGVVTTWSYDKLKMGEHKLLPEKFKFNYNITSSALNMTHCGNFVVIGYTTGHVERFNIQSGTHRASYGGENKAHYGPVKGIEIDCLNTIVITAGRDATVKFWPFTASEASTPKAVLDVKEAVEWLRSHRENSLIALALQDFTIILIDVDMRRIVRRFEGHNGRLTDATFSPDSRWLVTSSMDRTIRTWDIPSAQLIDIFKVSDACISISFSPTGLFLASAHVDNLGIYLWSNRTLYTHVSIKAIQSEEKIPLISLPGTTMDAVKDSETEESMIIDVEEDDEEYKSPDQLSKKLITMSGLATSRWLNLLNIDIIKKRNKPKDAPKTPASAPFFLPTIAALTPQFDLSEVKTQEDSNTLLVHPDFQNLTPFGRLLKQTVETNDFIEVIEKIKTMSPSAIDIEVQSLSFDVNNTEILLLQYMKMIKFMMKSRKDFELSQAYLSVFLKCHGNLIAEKKELVDYLEKLEKVQKKDWETLRELIFLNQSIINHIKIT